MAWRRGEEIVLLDVLTLDSVPYFALRACPPGRQILHRDVGAGKVVFARSMTVVHDRDDEVALYQACGGPVMVVDTVWAVDVMTREGLGGLANAEWPYLSRTWTDTNVLMLTVPDTWHSVWLMWEAQTWEFRCWYVNLQTPLTRTARGFDTSDKALDVVIAPNGEHRWKDEDHLDRAVDVGWISAADAQRVRSEGERVIERASRREYPFDGELISWRPDPAWPIPELPADWAAIAGEQTASSP